MIHQIMIIRDSGILLFEYHFTDINVDPFLTSGFIIALNQFSNILSQKEQEIKSVQMNNLQLILSKFDQFILILVVNNYDDIRLYDLTILELEKVFLKKFGQQDELFYTDSENFQSFKSDVFKACQNNIDVAIIGQNLSNSKNILSLLDRVLEKESKLKKRDKSASKIVNSSNNNGVPNDLENTIGENNILKNKNESIDLVSFTFKNIQNIRTFFWKYTYSNNLNQMLKLLNKKLVIYFLIEPDLIKLIEYIPLISSIKERYPSVLLLGIVPENQNNILKENCEILLQIKLFSLNLEDNSNEEELIRIIEEGIKGLV